MRQILKPFLLTLLVITPAITFSQGYSIRTTIHGIRDTSLILGYYFNKQMFVKDTIQVDENGTGTFAGEEPLDGGIYIVYLPDKSYFDLLISDDQDFSLETTAGDLVKSQKISGSSESGNFLQYQRFLNVKQEEAKTVQEKLKDLEKDSPEYNKVIEELRAIKKEVDDKMELTIEQNSGTFLANFLRSTKDVEVPDFDLPENSANKDSVFQVKRYNYYVTHYFDNIDLNDDRLLRTPVFTSRLERYFTKLLVQHPDTLYRKANYVIGKSENDKVRRYLIQYLFNMANESKVMGMDAMVVNLAERYYLSGEAEWADSTFLSKLQERVSKLKPNLIGKKAPDLKLQSIDGQIFKLSEVRAPITILVFWEPSCGHCKTEIPKLKTLVWDKYQKDGIKIFAVYTQVEQTEWKEFIEKHDLYEWMNVYDPYQRSNFRNLYDIYSTPTIFVLDKDKMIIGKRIGAEQLPGFIDYQLKNNSK